jgi:glycerol transport system ATP-binding protein
VSAVLFDEPLTVIDPHLKWQLRRKLKQIHQELKLTLIYVTHDQVEALTFAEQVVVMTRGRAVQTGSASELFDRPQHTFVGHFIGSPGMNFLPARSSGSRIDVAGRQLSLAIPLLADLGDVTLGVRPEYVALAAADAQGAVPAVVTQAQDIGTYWLLTAEVGGAGANDPGTNGTAPGRVVRARLGTQQAIPKTGDTVWLGLVGAHTCFYKDDVLVAEGAS